MENSQCRCLESDGGSVPRRQNSCYRVSNFLPKHLDALLETARIVPAVNQVRLAPGVYQEEVVDYCREKGILLEAWGPFGQGELFEQKEVQEIAAKHGKSVAQIALAWSLAEGFLPLPKSVTASRIQSNLDCFGIELSKDEREILKTISVTSGAPRVDEMDFLVCEIYLYRNNKD